MIYDNSHYSVKLHSLMENEQTKPLLEKALSTYPLLTPEKTYDLIPTREQLNNKLLNHYKYREIGCETVGQFLDYLEITMNEIMPYYNELFKTIITMAELENPFDNVDFTEEYEEERTNNTTTEGEGTNSSTSTKNISGESESERDLTEEDINSTNSNDTKKTKFSDTPQNSIDDINEYLTNYTEELLNGNETNNRNSDVSETNTSNFENTELTDANVSATSKGTSNSKDIVKHTFTKKGNQGVNTYAHDMNEFRTSIIDVVEGIINDIRIKELFMMIW